MKNENINFVQNIQFMTKGIMVLTSKTHIIVVKIINNDHSYLIGQFDYNFP